MLYRLRGDITLMGALISMDILKAYWRMDYIQSGDDQERRREDTFVDLPAMGDDRAALIVHRGEFNYLVLNKFPYNAGHLLAVPYNKYPDLAEMPREERADLMEMIIFGQSLLQKAFNPNGFNIGFNIGKVSGAGIPEHIHGHIIPRWQGDTNFISVIGETRVLPQLLDKTWEHLRHQLS